MRYLDIRNPIIGPEFMSFSKCNEWNIDYINWHSFDAILVCSIPLPEDVNVALRYYLDWIMHLLFGLTCIVMMWTILFFFGGMCLFIGGMADDLEQTFIKLEGDRKTMTKQISAEIAFHNEILE